MTTAFIAQGKTSYELSWKVKVRMKEEEEKVWLFFHLLWLEDSPRRPGRKALVPFCFRTALIPHSLFILIVPHFLHAQPPYTVPGIQYTILFIYSYAIHSTRYNLMPYCSHSCRHTLRHKGGLGLPNRGTAVRLFDLCV